MGLLRFLTCGSVDDGKSTLIGRLLFDTHHVLADQMAALESRQPQARHGRRRTSTTRCLLDGLQAEREQGITIDVAHRYFATARRSFIVADTPGHEQYTRNMATGASGCDLAVILVDARKGLLTQTRRHSTIVHLLGIRHVVLAVNKMDLVDFSEDRFTELAAEYRDFAAQLGIPHVDLHPCLRAFGRQHRVARARQCPGIAARRCLRTWKASTCREETAGRTIPHAGAVGQPPQRRFSRICRHDRQRIGCAGRPRRRSAVGPHDVGVAHRDVRRRSQTRRHWCDAVTLVLAEEIDIVARRRDRQR